MNIKLLTENEENCLKYLLNRENNVGFGKDDEILEEDVKNEKFDFSHFETLEKEGYIVAKIYVNCIYYHLTSKAIDYFPEKSKQEEQQKKTNRKATHRYWLDKLIPFLALLVSVIAMLNSVFDWWQV